MKTHYAVVVAATVIGTRSSDSRHVGGTGRFGPYTHACIIDRVTTGLGVLSYHGTEAAARDACRTWAHAGPTAVVPVIITAKRLVERTVVQ